MNPQNSGDESHTSGEGGEPELPSPSASESKPNGVPSSSETPDPKSTAAYWERRQFKVQKVIAYAGIIGIAIYALQLCEMRKSTDAATKAAQAAQDSVQFANKSARLDQRAWVTASTSQEVPQIGKVFTVTVTAKNNGKTFAREFKSRSLITRLDPDEVPDFKAGRTLAAAATKEGSVSILPPVGEYSTVTEINLSFKTSERPVPVTEESLKEFVAGKYRVLNYGWLTYYDIFGCDHWTIFCNELMPGEVEGTFKWRTYSTHNDADVNTCIE